MRCRFLRRCLLFALLGLVTAVVVAWVLAGRVQLGAGSATEVGVGVALADSRLISLVRARRPGSEYEWWKVDLIGDVDPTRSDLISQHMAQMRRELRGVRRDLLVEHARLTHPRASSVDDLDDVAAQGPPLPKEASDGDEATKINESAGWPALALHSSRHHRVTGVAPVEGAITVSWPWQDSGTRSLGAKEIYLPIKPRPGLLLNTIFYSLLWALLLLVPGALRRRIRRARGRCPACGYSLRGQPSPGCPECGSGRTAPTPAPGAPQPAS